jgi:hypothetical protein
MVEGKLDSPGHRVVTIPIDLQLPRGLQVL